jgi:lipopolysaccharide export system permease protein
LPINLPRFESFRTRGGKNLEYTLPELATIGRSQKASQELRDSSRAEFHFRMAEVASMFLLPMLAVALGVPPKRSTSALGVFLSIVIVVTYHKINQYAASLGERGTVDPLIALWVPFLVFAAITFWMYHTIARVPGGQPIGALERFFGKAWKLVIRYLPGRRAREARA